MYASEMNIEKIKVAAERGEPNAAFDLGWCCYIGNGVPRDADEARHWYRIAASGGIREASEILRVLEVETARAAELEALSTRLEMPAYRARRAAWLAGVALILVAAALVVFRPDILNRRATSIREGSLRHAEPVEQEVGLPTTAAQQKSQAPLRETLPSVEPLHHAPEQEEPPSQAKFLLATTEDTNDIIAADPEPSLSATARLEHRPITDINDVIEFAEKWLQEPP